MLWLRLWPSWAGSVAIAVALASGGPRSARRRSSAVVSCSFSGAGDHGNAASVSLAQACGAWTPETVSLIA